jgi:hypothetical protein
LDKEDWVYFVHVTNPFRPVDYNELMNVCVFVFRYTVFPLVIISLCSNGLLLEYLRFWDYTDYYCLICIVSCHTL